MLATTVNGFSGSRRSSRGAGTKVASGITGVDGLSKTGRLLGAQAAAWLWGAAVVKGGASGVWKSAGRSIGAYSGPSSHVAMQSS